MLSIPGKLLESQACKIIDDHLDAHELLSDKQWGFRKGRSTEGLLMRLTENWKREIDDGKMVGVVFIDFKKAFDTVPHEVLSYKLQAVGITGNLHQWIMDYLSERTQYTEINGSRSETAQVKYGVPQGSQLGPCLYSIDVNDFPESVNAGDLSMFADDTNVYCIGTSVEEVVDKLNIIMEQVHTWCTKKKLTVHPGKCEAMLLMKTPFIGPLQPLYYGLEYIKFVATSTCLGVVIDQKLSWYAQVAQASKNFSKKVRAIKRMGYLPKKVKEQIYYKTVIPCVTYCIAIWGNCSPALFDKIENIHARAARVIYKLPSELPNEQSLAMANWQPLSYIYKSRILSVMHQIYYDNIQSDIKNLFIKREQNGYDTRKKLQFEVQRYKSETGRNSSRYWGPLIRNSLSNELKKLQNMSTFKSNLKKELNYKTSFNFHNEAAVNTNKRDNFIYF